MEKTHSSKGSQKQNSLSPQGNSGNKSQDLLKVLQNNTDTIENSSSIESQYHEIMEKYHTLSAIYDKKEKEYGEVTRYMNYDQKKNCMYMQQPDGRFTGLSCKDGKIIVLKRKDKHERISVPGKKSKEYQTFTLTPKEKCFTNSKDQQLIIDFFKNRLDEYLSREDNGSEKLKLEQRKKLYYDFMDLVRFENLNDARHPVEE